MTNIIYGYYTFVNITFFILLKSIFYWEEHALLRWTVKKNLPLIVCHSSHSNQYNQIYIKWKTLIFIFKLEMQSQQQTNWKQGKILTSKIM